MSPRIDGARKALAGVAALFSLALPAALVAARAEESPPCTSIRGSVFSGRDEPRAGHTVTLLRDGAAPRTATTDGWGRFEFADLDAGATYAIVAEAEGCATARVPGIRLLPDERRDVGSFVLGRPGRIAVVVRDAAGRPVEGAAVDLFRNSAGPLGYYVDRVAPAEPRVPAATVRTDARGRVTLEVTPRCGFTVAATAPGLARVAKGHNYAPSGYEREVLIVLTPPAPLAGRVLDADGKPVARAVVAARTSPRVWDWHHGEREEGPGLWQRAEAGSDGRFAFDALPPGEIELLAGRPGGTVCYAARVETPGVSEVDLTVPVTSSIRGRCTDAATGAGVRGVSVAARFGWGMTACLAVTDAEGGYVLDGVACGDFPGFEVVLPDGWVGERPTREIERDTQIVAGTPFRLDFTAQRAAVVEGRVTSGGEPVPWVEVDVLGVAPDPGDSRWHADGVTDADGRFRIEDVVPGPVALCATPPGAESYDVRGEFRTAFVRDAAMRERVTFTAVAGEVATREVGLPAGAASAPRESAEERMARERDEIFGTDRVRFVCRVRTTDGAALNDARADVQWGEPDGVHSRSDLITTHPVPADGVYVSEERRDPDGEKVFTVIAFDANHDVAVVGPIVVRPDQEEVTVDVVLEPTPRLRCRVVCGDEPVAGATVRRDGVLVARSAADGRFDLRLRRSTIELLVEAAGCVRREFEDIDVPHEGVLDLVLAPATTLEGVVVGPDGAPLVGIRLTPIDEDGQDALPYAASGGPALPVTDAAGRFRFDQLPPGEFRLTVSSAPSAAVQVASKTSEPFATGKQGIRIVAETGRPIAGRVVGPDGEGVFGVEIECAGDDERTRLEDDREVRTDLEGRFRFAGLLPGDYRLDVVAVPAAELVPARRRLPAGKEDLEIVLEAAGVVSGTVVTAEGAPLGRAEIVVRRLDPWETDVPKWDMDLEDSTDKTGAFRILVPPAGRYAVEFRENSKHGREFSLRGAEDVGAGAKDLRLTAFAGKAIGGVARDPDGKPIWDAKITLRLPNRVRRTRSTVSDGVFRFPGLEPGVADVEVRGPGRVPRLLRGVRIGTTDLDVVLPTGAWIAGRLLDARGKPAKGWFVRALRVPDPAEPPSTEPPDDLWRVPVARGGDFEIHGLPEGDWKLDAVIVYVFDGGETVVSSVPLGTFAAGTRKLELRLPE